MSTYFKGSLIGESISVPLLTADNVAVECLACGADHMSAVIHHFTSSSLTPSWFGLELRLLELSDIQMSSDEVVMMWPPC